MESIEEREQQLLGVLLGVVVELGEDGAHHRSGLHRGTTGTPSQPHLLQQAHECLGHLALRPAGTEVKPAGKRDRHLSSESDRKVAGGLTLPALCGCPD